MAEARILRRDLLPEIPAVARLELRVELGRLVLAADGAVLDTAAVGDEQQVVFGQVDGLLLPVALHHDAARLLALAVDVKLHIHDLGVVEELHAVALEVAGHRQDDGFILVVAREAQRLEVRQAADVMDVALDVELHLQRAVPVLKGEHRAPVEPEVGGEDLVVEEIGDALILKLLIGRKEQAHDLHRALVADGELAVGMRVLAAVHGRAAEGRIRVFLVEPVVFVQHALTLMLEGRDIVQQIPHDLEMVVHLTAAAHHIADVHLAAVARAARNRVFFKDVDVLTLHLAVAHEVAGRGQRRKTGADDIRGLAVHAFRLLGMRERFIIAAAVIHNRNLLMIQAVPPGAFCPSGLCVPRISF